MKFYENNYPSYLQWQQQFENNAHLDSNGKCKVPTMASPAVGKPVPKSNATKQVESSIEAKPSAGTLVKIPRLDEDKKSIVTGDTLNLIMIRQEVIEFLNQFFEVPHQGMVWQITETIFNKNFKVNFKKASDL